MSRMRYTALVNEDSGEDEHAPPLRTRIPYTTLINEDSGEDEDAPPPPPRKRVCSYDNVGFDAGSLSADESEKENSTSSESLSDSDDKHPIPPPRRRRNTNPWYKFLQRIANEVGVVRRAELNLPVHYDKLVHNFARNITHAYFIVHRLNNDIGFKQLRQTFHQLGEMDPSNTLNENIWVNALSKEKKFLKSLFAEVLI